MPGLGHKHEEVLQACGDSVSTCHPQQSPQSAATAPDTIIGERAFLEFWMFSLIYTSLSVPTAHCVCVGSGDGGSDSSLPTD